MPTPKLLRMERERAAQRQRDLSDLRKRQMLAEVLRPYDELIEEIIEPGRSTGVGKDRAYSWGREDQFSEDRYASLQSGFKRENGRHVAVCPETEDGTVLLLPSAQAGYDWTGYRAHLLAEISAGALDGPYAIVFEALVLSPILGNGRRTVKELAVQLGVTEKRIYKIAGVAKRRVATIVRSPSILKNILMGTGGK